MMTGTQTGEKPINERAVMGSNSGLTRCIFRAHGDRGYTKLRNAFLQDRRISDETRGLVARLLSLPDDWEVTVQSVIASGKAGRDKVYRMIKEAEEFGYIRPERSRLAGGKFDRQLYLVSDDPAALIEIAALEIEALERARRDYDYPLAADGTTYVYVFQRGDHVKVGITKNPKSRVAALNSQEGNLGLAEPRHFHAADHWTANLIERAAHLRLKDFHIEGEWFRCSVEEAVSAINWGASHPLTGNPEMVETAEDKPLPENPEPLTANPEPLPGNPHHPLPDFPDPEDRTHKRNIDNNITLDNTPPIVPPTPEPEKRKRVRNAIPDEYPYDFEEFWKVYPRREGKAKAFEAWKRLTLPQKRRAYTALKKQIPELEIRLKDRRGNFCPLPATWINQGRFDDEPVPIGASPGRATSFSEDEIERHRQFMAALES